MKGRSAKGVKIAVDIAMAAVLVAVMATALVQEVPHEWLGIALFVLVAVHAVLNRKVLAALLRGRKDALRVLQIVAFVGLLACILGQVASSLVLSEHVFGFLPALPGAGWARRMHMLCSYWTFVLAFAHAGLHLRVPRDMKPGRRWAVRIVVAAIACYGTYAFVQLGMPLYLTGQVQFAMADFGVPPILAFARYAAVAVLVTAIFHYIRKALQSASARKRPEAE